MLNSLTSYLAIQSIGGFNTFIGGIGGVIDTAEKLKEVLTDEDLISDITIDKFETNGTDIRCAIRGEYDLRAGAFNAYTSRNGGVWYSKYGGARILTYFVDLGGNCISLWEHHFFFQESFSFLFFPNIKKLGKSFEGANGSQAIRFIDGETMYINGSYDVIEGLGSLATSFAQIRNPSTKLYCPNSLQTSSSTGGVDDDIQYYIDFSNGSVTYLTGDEIPTEVQQKIDAIKNSWSN